MSWHAQKWNRFTPRVSFSNSEGSHGSQRSRLWLVWLSEKRIDIKVWCGCSETQIPTECGPQIPKETFPAISQCFVFFLIFQITSTQQWTHKWAWLEALSDPSLCFLQFAPRCPAGNLGGSKCQISKLFVRLAKRETSCAKNVLFWNWEQDLKELGNKKDKAVWHLLLLS